MKNLVDFLILCIETVYFALRKPYMIIFNFFKKHAIRFKFFIKRKIRVFYRNYIRFFFRKLISRPLARLMDFLIEKHTLINSNIKVFFYEKLLFFNEKLNKIISFYTKKLTSSVFYKNFINNKTKIKLFVKNSNEFQKLIYFTNFLIKHLNFLIKHLEFFLFFRVFIIKRKTSIYFWKIFYSINGKRLRAGYALTQFKIFIENEIQFRLALANFVAYTKIHYIVYFFIFEDWCSTQGTRMGIKSHSYFTEDIIEGSEQNKFKTELTSRPISVTRRRKWVPIDMTIPLATGYEEWIFGFTKTTYVLHNRT